MNRKRTPPIERFFTRVQITESCWLWTGGKQTNGYSWFYDGTKYTTGHRFSYTTFVGPIKEGLQIDHLCRVRHCVNPDHLEPVTPLENTRRGLNAPRTTCKNGHVFDDANTYIRPNGFRACRACKREHMRKNAAKERNG